MAIHAVCQPEAQWTVACPHPMQLGRSTAPWPQIPGFVLDNLEAKDEASAANPEGAVGFWDRALTLDRTALNFCLK